MKAAALALMLAACGGGGDCLAELRALPPAQPGGQPVVVVECRS